jgi:Spy/CpxP family protein refolding chaperone
MKSTRLRIASALLVTAATVAAFAFAKNAKQYARLAQAQAGLASSTPREHQLSVLSEVTTEQRLAIERVTKAHYSDATSWFEFSQGTLESWRVATVIQMGMWGTVLLSLLVALGLVSRA